VGCFKWKGWGDLTKATTTRRPAAGGVGARAEKSRARMDFFALQDEGGGFCLWFKESCAGGRVFSEELDHYLIPRIQRKEAGDTGSWSKKINKKRSQEKIKISNTEKASGEGGGVMRWNASKGRTIREGESNEHEAWKTKSNKLS